jgi:Concanavalin A-like lectin/glucanases superfamily
MTVGMGPAFWRVPVEVDPYADDVIAHLWFDGDYTDRSQFAATYSQNDGVALASSPLKFGTKSLDTTYTPGANYYGANVSCAAAHLSPGNTEFTVEFWFYEPVLPANGNTHHFMFTNAANGHTFRIYSVSFKGDICFDVAGGPNSGSSSVSQGWHHVALTRLNNAYDMWLDGSLAQSVTNSTMNTGTHGSGTYTIWVGGASSPGSSYATFYSNFRFTKKRRYSAAFSVPTAPFPDPVP